MDATSVYGYPGAVTSLRKSDNKGSLEFRKKFQENLLQGFNELKVICFFSRQNSLLPGTWLFESDGDIIRIGKTVVVDLTLSEEEHDKNVNQNHRRNIKKGIKKGITVYLDTDFSYLNNFISMYNETMERNNALDYYFFPKSYYTSLLTHLNDHVYLFIAKIGDIPISAALIFGSKNILQYHLSGTPTEYLKLSPLRILLEGVRQWGRHNGFKWLHLGGGVDCNEDSLFRFKAGFSKLRFPFEVVRMVLEPSIYAELVQKQIEWENINQCKVLADDYFPLYRRPVVE